MAGLWGGSRFLNRPPTVDIDKHSPRHRKGLKFKCFMFICFRFRSRPAHPLERLIRIEFCSRTLCELSQRERKKSRTIRTIVQRRIGLIIHRDSRRRASKQRKRKIAEEVASCFCSLNLVLLVLVGRKLCLAVRICGCKLNTLALKLLAV